jgi:cyclopropane fatty-acyl-phospholipid synthase-like methyltransferase
LRYSPRSLRGARDLSILRQRLAFRGSASYWERRYELGGNSGAGSYGDLAYGKAAFLNSLVMELGIETVTEFGCGDGHQLSLASYPAYIGLDVSRAAIQICQERFATDETKSFFLYDGSCHVDRAGVFAADLTISLDVIYHLVEDPVFTQYMTHLFAAGRRHVVIYATNTSIPSTAPHVRHREFSAWINQNCPDWRLCRTEAGPVGGPTGADFFTYERQGSGR